MKNKFDFQPKLFTALRNYSKERFMTDLMAGIIVGIVALPLAIAFGIASGVSPEKGLITAIIGGFIVSLLGGCNVQIGGPTGAFIVIVYGIIQNFGIEGLAIATVIAGIILVLMGVLKLGTVIKFIPYPIVVGFTSGIAITIFTTQMKDLFGLTMDKVPADFTRGLTIVTKLPHNSVMIRADGRQLYRAIENLYTNAAKYALENTRVYVDLEVEENNAVFRIKNISKNPLPEQGAARKDLTERFVRGEESRTTEGSGLGLSIAKNLTQLMGGEFAILVDGDLFAASITFAVVA